MRTRIILILCPVFVFVWMYLTFYEQLRETVFSNYSPSSTGCRKRGYNTMLIHGTMEMCEPSAHENWGNEKHLAIDSMVLRCGRLPDMKSHWPSIGNGHIATVVNTDTIFMNGLYNGVNVTSHRARIPSTCNIEIVCGVPSLTSTEYILDLEHGIFIEKYEGEGYTVSKRIYAHRVSTRLIVVEVNVTTTTANNVQIELALNRGNESTDIDFSNGSSEIPGTSYEYGLTNEAETEASGRTHVHVYNDNVPKNIVVIGQHLSRTFYFMTSISADKEDAHSSYLTGVELLKNGSLYSSHRKAWNNLWSEGRIDVRGNDTIAKTTYASLYYIMSSLPLKRDDKWPFVGLSPSGLAHGETEDDYEGHVFWDQDTWMFPVVLILHPNIGKLMVNDRIRTLDAAKTNAKMRGYNGAMYPWESAYSGLDVTPCPNCSAYEIHITGDVAMGFQQYLMMTNDTDFLKNERGEEAVLDIAEFWSSRVVMNEVTREYEIHDVMPPDEWHYRVNNSAYTNCIAKLSLLLPKYALGLMDKESPQRYEDIANNMHIPFDEDQQYHPEFDGYTNGTIIKQADVILMGFPLMYDMTEEVRRNDLVIYEKVTPRGPAMTWGMFAIGWMELNETEKAKASFERNMMNAQPPFYIWTENSDGTGAVNFQTGMGGFLQSLIFGYGGLRIHRDRLQFNPNIIPTTTGITVTGLDYLGNSLDIEYNEQTLVVTLTIQGNVPLFLVHDLSKHRQRLYVDTPINLSRQPFFLTCLS